MEFKPPTNQSNENENNIAKVHCLSKILEISTLEDPDRRALLQLGFNLGRLSEIEHLGRELWDIWKGPVTDWNQTELRKLALQLHQSLCNLDDQETSSSTS